MGLYFLPSMSVGGKPLRKVDLLADIRPDVEEEVCDSDTIVLPPPVKPIFVDTCKTGITCIEDYSDSTMRGMKHFYEALSKVKTMKRPVRIAYFGDSFIEADIFTADLREMLQQEFGGCGVGYVPVTSSISGYRPTVRHTLIQVILSVSSAIYDIHHRHRPFFCIRSSQITVQRHIQCCRCAARTG